MLELKHKRDCCGCGACAQCCPKGCITLQEDEEGFLYPDIDREKCVNCGLCRRVCPMLQEGQVEGSVLEAYAARAQDNALRKASSSGGIFSLLAQWVLDDGGVVFGAALDRDLSVHHIMVEREEELYRLRGSKYVQSRMENAYRQVKSQLELGKKVLFTGVACQIAGLMAFLGKDCENLYTVDVLCHGVPSPKLWQRYLDSQREAHSSEITQVSFRNKEEGWKLFSMELTFENGEIYREIQTVDDFMVFFLSDICLRPSCYSCRFKELPRMSDLTIGDAWGVEHWMPELDDDQGTSVVLVNTPKGRVLWEAIAFGVKSRVGDVDTMLPETADSRRSVNLHPGRKNFFRALNNGASMEELKALTRRTLPQRVLSVGKRCVKKLLRS